MNNSIQTVEQARELFSATAEQLEKQEVPSFIAVPINDDRFWTWPASCMHHHMFNGGLAIHTAQVLQGAIMLLNGMGEPSPDDNCIMVNAVIWHDYGKVYDYELVNGVWQYADHKYKIGHVSRSYQMWMSATTGYSNAFRDAVGHAILAHHGRNEWGSPVEPQTAIAYAIHAADMMSAHYLKTPEPGVSIE